MNPLWEAVQLMSKEEVRAFKLFAQKVEVTGSRKDIELFDLVRRTGTNYDEDSVIERHYKGAERNTFHRLKSRLLDTMNRSLFMQYLDRNDTFKLMHWITMVDFFLQRRHIGLAQWHLRKAERLAKQLEHLEALDLIYTLYIRLSTIDPKIDPTEFIRLRKANHAQLARLRQLDDVLCAATHRATITQTYGESGGDLIDLLRNTVAEFTEGGDIAPSTTLRIKLFQAIIRILLDRRDYITMESYVQATYEEFLQERLFTRNNHEVKLQMITYLVNALNKNKKFEASLSRLQEMDEALNEHEGMLRDRFLFFYYNGHIINYFSTNIDRAIEMLDQMMLDPHIQKTPFYLLFGNMNLALAWYDKGKHKKAIRILVKSYLLDAYTQADPAIQLRINMAELMMRYELEDLEVLEQRIRQVRHDFRELLSKEGFAREYALLELLQRMALSTATHADARLREQAGAFVRMHVPEDLRDAELIPYDDFVKRCFKL